MNNAHRSMAKSDKYDTNNNIVATLSCQNDWVNGLDLNDTKKNREILQKVIATAITNKPITAPLTQYDPRVAKIYRATETNWQDDRYS